MPERPRGKTVAECLNPETLDQLVQLAEGWCKDATDIILDAVWNGYDRLIQDPAKLKALQEATDDLERGITQLLELEIHEGLSGEEPFDVQHGVPEGESRKPPPARPPEYDIAFIMNGNIRIMWPIEAKVMPPDRPLRGYVDTVNERYLTCEYAPFVSEGAMAGYILRSEPLQAFDAIGKALGSALLTPQQWMSRPHRISNHTRQVPEGKPFPAIFRCHHLMMVFKASVVTDEALPRSGV